MHAVLILVHRTRFIRKKERFETAPTGQLGLQDNIYKSRPTLKLTATTRMLATTTPKNCISLLSSPEGLEA